MAKETWNDMIDRINEIEDDEEYRKELEKLELLVPEGCVYLSEGVYISTVEAELMKFPYGEESIIPCTAEEMNGA